MHIEAMRNKDLIPAKTQTKNIYATVPLTQELRRRHKKNFNLFPTHFHM